jgi:hypothetical protein
MGHVKYAMDAGWIPIIDMQSHENTFLSADEVGNVNAWEFFFEQPCGYNLEDIKNSKNIILSNAIIDGKITYPSRLLTYDEMNLNMWRTLFRQFFFIKKEINIEIDKYYQEYFKNHKVLGVICRGTDYINVKPPLHPVQPSLEELLQKVSEVFIDRKCDTIFVVTEDEDAYQTFLDHYDEKMIKMEAKRYRNTGTTNINDVIASANDSIYLLTKEYLVSIALLSRCNCLVGGAVGGTYGALAMSDGYEYQYIFDLGVYP